LTYELTQEQQILRETIRDFAQSEIVPQASKIDSECEFPPELLAKLPRFGLFGVTVPSELGGAGADFLSLVIAIEEVSRASGSLGASLSFHNAAICEALISSTNTTLRERMLRRLTSGSLGAYDVSTIHQENKSKQIICRIDDSTLLVNGYSDFVVNAAAADIFLVLGTREKTDSENEPEPIIFCFSRAETSKDQFSVGEPRRLLGMRASQIAKISFNNLRLPLQSLVYEISKVKQGLRLILARGNLAVASQALGIAQASIDASVKYANERLQFGTKIGNFYAVQDMIASDSVDLETARSLTYLTAQEINSSSNLERDAAIAKISSSNAAVQASRHAIRVHGGYGFTRDYPVERFARDARLTQIYTESNEELKARIAKSLLGQT
jgi:alkylation response protein AidB-like acyl-CoA dehydrogenase